MIRWTTFKTLILYLTAFLLPLSFLFGRSVPDALISAIAIIFLIHTLWTKNFKIFRHPLLIPCYLFWLYFIGVSFTAIEPWISFKKILPWIRYPFFALALTPLLRYKQSQYLFKWAVIILFLMLIFFLLYELISGSSLVNPISQYHYSGRIYGPYNNPHSGIIIQALTFPAIIYLLLRLPRLIFHPIPTTIFWITIYLGAILVTGNRMPFFISLIQVSLFFMLGRYPQKRHLVWYWVSILTGAVILFLFQTLMGWEIFPRSSATLQRVIGHTSALFSSFSTSYFASYLTAFAQGLSFFFLSPVTGTGIGQLPYYSLISLPGRFESISFLHPHNFYIEILGAGGFIGMAIFIFLLWRILTPGFKHFSIIRNESMVLAVFITVLLYFFPLFATPSFFTSWASGPLWLMIGWLFYYYHQFHLSPVLPLHTEKVSPKT